MVIDTNVFLSGLLFGGKPEKILKLWMKKKFIVCISPKLKAEIINKLRYKFEVEESFIQEISDRLDRLCEKYIPKHRVKICKDPTDNFLLELARASGAKYLISGDKLVLDLKKYKETQIISPASFLEKINERNDS